MVLSLFACKEKEDPIIIFGDYAIVSMVSSEAIDITDNGVVSVDLLTQLKVLMGTISDLYHITLYDPRFYSEIIFRLPQQSEYPQGILIDSYYGERKYELRPDGRIVLDFITEDYFDDPYQLELNLKINDLVRESKSQTIHLEALQKWYDYSQGNWKEITIKYQFKKWGTL